MGLGYRTNLGNLDKWKSRQSLRVSIVVKIKKEFELLYRECLQCTVNGYQNALKEQNCIKYAEKTMKSIIWKN